MLGQHLVLVISLHCGLKSVSSETTRTGDHLNTIFSADLHGSRNIRARYESMHMCVCMYLLNWWLNNLVAESWHRRPSWCIARIGRNNLVCFRSMTILFVFCCFLLSLAMCICMIEIMWSLGFPVLCTWHDLPNVRGNPSTELVSNPRFLKESIEYASN